MSEPRADAKSGRPFRAGRVMLLAASCALLCLLSRISGRHHPWISYSDCVSDPVRHDGLLVEEFREPVIGALRKDGFELLQAGEPPVFVEADTAGLAAGEFVGLKAYFHKEGYLTAAVAVVAARRREKMMLSLVPAALVLALFFRRFAFDPKRIEFRVRSRA